MISKLPTLVSIAHMDPCNYHMAPNFFSFATNNLILMNSFVYVIYLKVGM